MSHIVVKDLSFQWDHGNERKNLDKHSVTQNECEEVFFNTPLLTNNDELHSITENRYYLLGLTNNNRKLFIVFTIRHSLIRIISARDMSRKERVIYEKISKNPSI